jgi:hypothetical protein
VIATRVVCFLSILVSFGTIGVILVFVLLGIFSADAFVGLDTIFQLLLPVCCGGDMGGAGLELGFVVRDLCVGRVLGFQLQ